MALEVEARFRVVDPEALATLRGLERLGDARLEPAATVREVDRYLDTDDGRLAAARWACRLREREGVTTISLKGPPEPGETAAWLHRRPEIEGPATPVVDVAAWPPSPARERLATLTNGRALRERFRLVQDRTERGVRIRSERIGTLTADAVRVVAGDRDLGSLDIVELELSVADAAGESVLHELAAALAAIRGLEAEPRTKLEHALERLGAG